MINTEYYEKISEYIEIHFEEYKDLIKTLTAIPAPSHKEDLRVKYLLELLAKIDIKAHSDEAKNVVIDEFYTGEDTHMYMAHIDTVFPDEDAILVIEEDGRIKAPGVGDDTTNVAAVIMTLKFIKEFNIKPKRSLLFALNSCEEGLGNLKGSRQLLKTYGNNITQVISFDLGYDSICNGAVGSLRYEITIKTEGGHSFYSFGNKNAIEYMARLINEIYKVDVSKIPGKNTYNVGVIRGGTSVNTISEDAVILFEYRADTNDGLEWLKNRFESIFNEFKNKYDEIDFKIQLVGERPSQKGVDMKTQEKLALMGQEIIQFVNGTKPEMSAASTDCNIPLSQGIPAVCYGTYEGGGEHTRGEYVEIKSLQNGLRIAMLTVMQEF